MFACMIWRWHARVRGRVHVPVPADRGDYEADETRNRTTGDHHCRINKFSIEVTDNKITIIIQLYLP